MDWIPTPGSAKGRLVLAALEEFSAHGFDGVNVVELTRRIGLTTGVLYHHFGSKTGLYNVVREELERRVVDRMEGAFEALDDSSHRGIAKAAFVGFDATVKMNACRILSEEPREDASDMIASFFSHVCEREQVGLGAIVLASWRAAIGMVADGLEPAPARKALEWIFRK